MNRDQMVELWEQHTAYEFQLRDADLAVSTMVDDASVMHLPTMSGGIGHLGLLLSPQVVGRIVAVLSAPG